MNRVWAYRKLLVVFASLLLVYLTVLSAGIYCLSLSTAGEGVSKPSSADTRSLYCEGPKIDLGDCYRPVGISEQFFYVKNTGKKTVFLSDVKPSCGCVTATLDKECLSPDDTVKVRALWDLRNKSGTQGVRISVVDRADSSNYVLLTLRANILERLDVHPAVLDFGDISHDEQKSIQFIVSQSSGQNLVDAEGLVVDPVGIGSDQIEIKLLNAGKETSTYQATVFGRASPSFGTFSLILKDMEYERIVPAFCNWKGLVSFNPKAIVLKNATLGSKIEIVASHALGGHLEVLGAIADDNGLLSGTVRDIGGGQCSISLVVASVPSDRSSASVGSIPVKFEGLSESVVLRYVIMWDASSKSDSL